MQIVDVKISINKFLISLCFLIIGTGENITTKTF